LRQRRTPSRRPPLITIAGNSDHDRLETVITMLWNG
jgi:hypothetical protein